MVFAQYDNLFSLFLFSLFLVPAIILGIHGRNLKRYGMIISIPALCCIMGISTIHFLQFVLFLVLEMLLILIYYRSSKKNGSGKFYKLIFVLSIIPVVSVKIGEHFTAPIGYNLIGFVGISYISFRVWQLLFEIHDGHVQELSILNILYFITFFPTVSSGPIDRYKRFTDDADKTIQRTEYISGYLLVGLKKIFLGIAYKFAIAACIKVYIMDRIPSNITLINAVIYMYAYTFYLFFDFAGYSNFAIGTSYILGIQSPENFNKPFFARNMKEFWDRWHISLSKWFGDYIFSRFVLNTLRSGKIKSKKTAVRIGYLLSMTIMGLWHGFYLFYVLYGLYEGLMLVASDVYVKSKAYRNFKKAKYYDNVSRAICFQIIAFGMLLFSGYLFKF
ncbi:D-alanyl-lipoteichoic acid biosynthesis protein DltB [Caproicibacter fermentans]|uniref:D-alanyl-lipoteichoic acid biosynthesis protein DltB n=1 Tax=Caproicibacter fermentans TaxID=2576756 RepID=A0A7G8TF60_9FIRM|nr:D-alanyl-lipoteichoic acid biosynthesis protein DltB [Caproicibacter fermentans]QNK42251.1 D-alanyl-lipoteichoic acid biosynthesis protein DltB [Caproicibacter fermentans]